MTPEPTARVLTDKQQALVVNMMTGAMTLTAAGLAAGYSDASAASRAWALDHVQEAYRQAALHAMRDQIPLAISARQALLSAKSELVRLQAVQDVLDRAGLTAPKEGVVTVGTVNIQINLGDV